MIVKPLDDPGNKIVRHALRLLKSRSARDKTHQFVLEGPHLALEALRAQARVRAVLYSERLLERPDGATVLRELTGGHVRMLLVTDRLLDQLSDVDTHQGILTVADQVLPQLERLTAEDWLLADGVQDPGNLGTMMRAAAAFGFRVGILPGTVDPFNPKVVRASAGTLFQARLARIEWPAEWPDQLSLVATDPRAPVSYDRLRWRRPVGLVVGNEAAGIAPELRARANQAVSIPMEPAVESLNAGVAAAIIMAHIYIGERA